jgi:glycosyltransferase involved in cell wall biosynthesis
MPVVTIILNSYNQRDYLRESVESALAQTFEDFELLIVDNGSSDGSQELLRGFSDPRIRLFLHGENIAISRRFNEAIASARGEFISFLYSDDCYLPQKLERQVALFRSLPADYGVVYSPAIGFNQLTGTRWTHGSFALSGLIVDRMFDHFSEGFPDMISPMTRRECFLRYPFYDDIFAEGEAIYLRIAMTYRFHFDREPTTVVRDHDKNRGKAITMNHEMTKIALERLAAHPDYPPAQLSSLRGLRARLERDDAFALLRLDGDAGWARARLRDVLAVDPRQAAHPRYAAAVLLSLLPSSLRRVLNRVGDRVRRRRGNRKLVADYR